MSMTSMIRIMTWNLSRGTLFTPLAQPLVVYEGSIARLGVLRTDLNIVPGCFIAKPMFVKILISRPTVNLTKSASFPLFSQMIENKISASYGWLVGWFVYDKIHMALIWLRRQWASGICQKYTYNKYTIEIWSWLLGCFETLNTEDETNLKVELAVLIPQQSVITRKHLNTRTWGKWHQTSSHDY